MLRRIALILDNPRRDLCGLTLLAYHLAKQGVESYIVPMYQQGNDIPLLSPEIVVVNYARENNRELLAEYRRQGIRVAVLDTEGGVLSESGLDAPENWARTIRESGLNNLIDHYFFWGSAVHKAFLVRSGISQKRLHLTGCPRYDLCAKPWRDLLKYKRSGFVLVNTNYSAVNPVYTGSADAERKIFESLGWDSTYVRMLFKDLRDVLPKYLNAIEELANALPNTTIQIRPHPFENSNLYIKRFAKLCNIVVDSDGDVLNVIANAVCVVHLNCGTAVESILLGKTPISMEFLNTKNMLEHASLPSQISCPANSIKHLITLVSDSCEGKIIQDHTPALSVIRPWFHEVDGRAAERVAVFLEQIQPEYNPAPLRNWTTALRSTRLKPSIGQFLQAVLCLVIGSRAVEIIRGIINPARSAKTPDLAIIQTLLEQFAKCEGKPPRITARYSKNPVSRLSLSTIEIVAVK